MCILSPWFTVESPSKSKLKCAEETEQARHVPSTLRVATVHDTLAAGVASKGCGALGSDLRGSELLLRGRGSASQRKSEGSYAPPIDKLRSCSAAQWPSSAGGHYVQRHSYFAISVAGRCDTSSWQEWAERMLLLRIESRVVTGDFIGNTVRSSAAEVQSRRRKCGSLDLRLKRDGPRPKFWHE